jgi:hypothetical protein
MKYPLSKLYWNKDARYAFHLEKEDALSAGQLKVIMEQDAWTIRRLLESPDLYRQSFALQLNPLVKNLLKSHSYYQQCRMRKVMTN